MFCQGREESTVWNLICTARAPQRVCVFLWHLWHDRLLSNMERCRRHMTDDGFCPLCNVGLETALHTFRDCAFAKAV